MSKLVDGLGVLESAVKDCRQSSGFAQLGKLPRIVALLLDLLGSIVHELERQKIFLKNMERGSDGDNR